MPRIRFDVPVATDEDEVRDRLNKASKSPQQFVKWFTSDPKVKANVKRDGIGWTLQVEGPQFRAVGTADLNHRDPGSIIAIDLDIKGRGLLAFASPALILAAGKIEGEATEKLQAEFGPPA